MFSGSASTFALNPEDAFALYSDRVISFAYGYLHDFDKAEDAAQQAWVQAISKWHQFDGANPLGWLRVIVHNVVRMGYRARGPYVGSLDSYLEGEGKDSDSPPPVPQRLIHELDDDLLLGAIERDGCVHEAFRSLSAQHQAVIRARLLSGGDENNRMAAKHMGVSHDTFRVRLVRARECMKELIVACCT